MDEVQGLEDHQLAALDGGTHVFTNQFVVEAEGAPEAVKKLAHEHGFLYLGHVSVFAHYHYANLLLSIFRIYSPLFNLNLFAVSAAQQLCLSAAVSAP